MSATPDMAVLFDEIEASVRAVTETYSNVHRGRVHFSHVTTQLFEVARDKVRATQGLSRKQYLVIFCTPRQAALFAEPIASGAVRSLSSESIGLALGVRALIVKRSALLDVSKCESGGGTARLVAPDWVVWAKGPHRFEAGTPAIVNVIAFAKALQLLRRHGLETFRPSPRQAVSAEELLRNDELGPLSGWDLLEKLRRTHIGHDARVPTRFGTRRFVNFDNAASTPTFMPILSTFAETLRQPSAVRAAIVREVESICANALGAPSASYEVIFTSNTTEGTNLVARSLGRETTGDFEPVVLNTLLEHNSNELPWRALANHTLIRLPVDEQGFIDLRQFEAILQAYNRDATHGKQRIRLVALSAASNVLGAFNDLDEICRIAHAYDARVFVDAAQLVGHRRVDMQRTGADYLVFSAHKMYAPFGSGALVVRRNLLSFGVEEMKCLRESGEANAAGIAAMGKAFLLLQRIGMDVVQTEEQLLTAHALERLATVPQAKIFGVQSPSELKFTRRGGVIALGIGMSMPSRLARELAEMQGIGVRYGCHCAHLLVKRLHKVPPLIEKLQWLIVSLFPNLELPGLLRVSFGIQNSREQVDALVAALTEITGHSSGSRSRRRSPRTGTHRMPQREYRRLMDDYLQAAARRVYCQE